MFTSTLANWDGRLSGSATKEAQPARGSTSASTVSTTPAVLDSTSSSAAASSTDFNSPYAFTNGKQRTDKKVSGDVTLLDRKQQFTASRFSTKSAHNQKNKKFQIMGPATDTRTPPSFRRTTFLHPQTSDEKEEDDDDEMVVDAMLENPIPDPLVSHPSTRVSSSSSRQLQPLSPPLQPHEPLFTPPRLLDDLFTPPPEAPSRPSVSPQKLRQRPKARPVMAYVAVPYMSRVEKAQYADGRESGRRELDARAQAERRAQNPIFAALSAGLRHNGAHIQTYMSSKAKGKARARTVTTSSEDDEESDYGTIFVSRPLKRKGKSYETDDDDDRSYGSPPRKRKYVRRPEVAEFPSGSSAHVPLPQALSKDRASTKTKPGPKPKANSIDLLLLDVDVNIPPELLPTTRATLSSIRHLRKAYAVDGMREKTWEARYDVGDKYPEPAYVADDVAGLSSSKKKTKAKSRVSYPARVVSSAGAPLGSPPGGVSGDNPSTASGANGFGMTASGQYHQDVSVSASATGKKGKGRPRVQALGSLSPQAHTFEGGSTATTAKITIALSDGLTNNLPREMDVISTDADAEGEVDMDYFLNDLENRSGAAGVGTAEIGTALSDNVVGDKEKNDEEERSAGLMPMSATFSSPQADPLSSLNIYSSEGHVHADHPTMNGIDSLQPDADPFLSDPNRAGNGDDTFYSTPNDFTSSPWVSGGEGDYSPVDTVAGLSANGTWNGTIDPSLLGGGEQAEPQALTPSPSPPPFVARGKLSNAVASSSRLSMSSHAGFSDDLLHRRQSSQRVPRPRFLDSYVDIDDLDLSARSESESESEVSSRELRGPSGYTSDSKYESDASDSDSKASRVAPTARIPDGSTSTSTSASRDISEVATSPPISAPKSAAPKKGVRRNKLMNQPPGVTGCHQCRRYTTREKMQCSNIRPGGDCCPYRFCINCIEIRYPSILFDSQNRDFICPKCTNICNCTVCVAKRGEVYVSSRGGRGGRGRGRGRGTPGARLTRGRSGQGTTSKVKSTHFSEVPRNATKYWGTIYGTTGEKIGTAFVGEDDDARVVVPRLTRASASNLQPKRRIFIGQIQDSWGLKNYTIKDVVDDSPLDNHTGKGKGKAKEHDPSSRRMYIGKKPPRFTRRPPPALPDDTLFHQFPASPSSAQGNNLIDLTHMTTPSPKDWPEPAVGESAYFGYDPTPISALMEEMDDELGLSPGKMEMAIALGLSALQVPN